MASTWWTFYCELTDESITVEASRTLTAIRRMKRVWRHGKFKGNLESFKCPMIDEWALLQGWYR